MHMPHHGDKNTTVTCPVPSWLDTEGPEKFTGNFTFHQFNMILSGSCTAITCLVIFTLMAMHATRLSNPNEQIKIMRICTLLPLYSIFSFLSICFPNAYVYLEGWTEVFQGMALYNFLMLLCDFLAPSDRHRVYFFSSFAMPKRRGRGQMRDGLSWLQRTWCCVLQYPVVAFILAIVACITQAQGTYCLDSRDTHFAYIWLNILQIISTVLAIGAIIRFYRRLASHMAEHKPLVKLLAFKVLVALVFLEKIIFTGLHSTNTIEPSATMSYADVHIGLPTMIICLQIVPFAFFFHCAYSTKPYQIRTRFSAPGSQESLVVDPAPAEDGSVYRARYQGGPLGLYAWCALVNPLETFREGKSTWQMLRNARAAPMHVAM